MREEGHVCVPYIAALDSGETIQRKGPDALEQIRRPKGQHSQDLQPARLDGGPSEEMIYHDEKRKRKDGAL